MNRAEELVFDQTLPARAGDVGLAVPTADRVAQWVARLLATDATPEVVSVRHERVRWKPGVSLTALHEVRFCGGERALVTTKGFADGKQHLLAARGMERRRSAETVVLHPWAFVPEARTALWVLSADRHLVGSCALLDPRKLCRALEASGFAPERALRRSSARYELLRYKPERRAVWRASFELRSEPGHRLSVVARVHPPGRAARIAAARTAFGHGTPRVPRLLGQDAERGWILEEDLPVTAADKTSFAHTGEAARLLAELHRPCAAAARAPRSLRDERALLGRIDPALAHETASLVEPRAPPLLRWTHGDAHPDQLARDAAGAWYLLDLDELGPRDHHVDLASWIADRVAADPATSPRAAAGELLDSYVARGGAPVDDRALEGWLARELVVRAAGAVRRLDPQAEATARRLTDTAVHLGHATEATRA